MRCVAVIDTDNSEVDTVILWDDTTRLVAVGYRAATIQMRRPLAAQSFDEAMDEVRRDLGITSGTMARISAWSPRTEPPWPSVPDRWAL